MIGVDLVSIERIRALVEKYSDTFLAKFLNPTEIALVKGEGKFHIHRIAGFFATKEALSKALGCGIGNKLAFHDITISKNIHNAPQISVKNHIKKNFGIDTIEVSISHDKDYAIAVVLVK